MLAKVSFGVWTMVTDHIFSYKEVDDAYNTLYSISYPITRGEAMDLSRWATNRLEFFDASPSLDADGWYVYLLPNKVNEPESYFYAAQVTDRKDDEYNRRYGHFINLCHTINEPCVE